MSVTSSFSMRSRTNTVARACALAIASFLSTRPRHFSTSGLGTATSSRVTRPCQSTTIHASASVDQPTSRHERSSSAIAAMPCSTADRWIAPVGSRISTAGVLTTYVGTGFADAAVAAATMQEPIAPARSLTQRA
jgi:hypothetical protein